MPRPNADRKWYIDLEDPMAGDELDNALGEVALILNRLGGAAVIVAERTKLSEDLYVTSGLTIKHDLYASPVRESNEEYERGPEVEVKEAPSNGSEVAVEAG